MRFLSLFSGIEAASVAWEKGLDWECAAVCEILPFQSSVIKKHYPELRNFGDVTKITEDDVKSLGQLDVVIFGSPCQDMSIAGKRMGLEAEKEDTNHSSRLFFEGMRVFRLAQKHCGARFLLWENVPGALSSNEGKDFGRILEEMVGISFGDRESIWGTEGVCFGGDSMCEWSVLDAQYFGLAARRKRVFVILDTGNWRDRSPILLEQETMRGINSPGGRVTKTMAEKSFRNFTKTNKLTTIDIFDDVFDTVNDTVNDEDFVAALAATVIGRSHTYGPELGISDVMWTLTASDHHALFTKDGVRRMTPLEAERLQGFPDFWTQTEKSTDTKRINAIGRSMAVPVIKWMGEQIERAKKESE